MQEPADRKVRRKPRRSESEIARTVAGSVSRQSLLSGRAAHLFDMEVLLLASVDRGATWPWRVRKWLLACYGPALAKASVKHVFDRLEHLGLVSLKRETTDGYLRNQYRLTETGRVLLREVRVFYARVCGMDPDPASLIEAKGVEVTEGSASSMAEIMIPHPLSEGD